MTAEVDGAIAIDKLKDLYKHCIRLSNSNKINAKNAFDLQLIDYLGDLIKSSEQPNFKIASSALDVGAKIYSNRVDWIQSEAQKVASSILMALDGKSSGSGNPDEEQEGNTSMNSDRMDDSREDEEGHTRAHKKKQPTRKGVKTVIDPANVNQLYADLDEVKNSDQFFSALSEDSDISHASALVNHNAPIRPQCRETVDSEDRRKDYLESTAQQTSTTDSRHLTTIIEEKEDTEATRVTQQLPSEDQDGDTIMNNETSANTETTQSKTTSEVNPSTNATTTTTMHGQTTTTQSQSNSSDLHVAPVISKHTIHVNKISSKGLALCFRIENFLLNDRTTTIPGLNSNLDESIVSIGNEKLNANYTMPVDGDRQFVGQTYDYEANDYGDDHFNDAESICGDAQPNEKNENDLLNLDKLVHKPSEYAYSNAEHHRLLNTWAGPHAWKAVKNPLTCKKDGAPKSTRKRAKLEHKPIDFEEKFLASLEEIANKDIRHSADVIRRWKKPLLPQDHNLTEESIRATLIHTFLRPEDTYHCMKTPADALKLVDSDHAYTNNGRSGDIDDPPSPGMGGFDDVHDDSDDEFRADPVVDGNEVALFGAPINNTLTQQVDLEFAGEHLIEQPYTVAQVNIPFAKIAKKMDVRRLKRVMWDLLLPPEKRAELSMMQANNVTVVERGPENADKSDSEQVSNTTGGDELDQTVIENGASEVATKKTPSPTPSESAVHLEFSNLYGELPVRVSSKMADDLSQPIAFVTLLHLANEKDLVAKSAATCKS